MLDLAPFLAYVFVTTFTPGPNNVMSMSNGLRYGYRQTLAFIGGVFTGFVVVMLLCSLLNFVLFSLLPQVKFWMNIVGALYMLYLAVHIALSKPIQEGSRNDRLNTFQAGFAMQFLNLKVILYGITVFSSFIIPAYGNSWPAVAFGPLLASIGVVSCSCWAVGGDIFRRFLNRYNRVFNVAMGLLLVYTAVASLVGK